jgi:tRNA dimethylallyltransferase
LLVIGYWRLVIGDWLLAKDMKRLVVVIGATGVGKTARAIEVAKQYSCPIISADSRQIYRDLPIGTAAPTAEERAQAEHH